MFSHKALFINLIILNVIFLTGISWYFYTTTLSYHSTDLSIVDLYNFSLYIPTNSQSSMENVDCKFISNFTYDFRTQLGIVNYTHFNCQSLHYKRIIILVNSSLPVLISRFNYSGLGAGHYLVDQIYIFWQQTYFVTVNLDTMYHEFPPVLQLFSQSLGLDTINQTSLILSGGLETIFNTNSFSASSPFAIIITILIGLSIISLLATFVLRTKTISSNYDTINY